MDQKRWLPRLNNKFHPSFLKFIIKVHQKGSILVIFQVWLFIVVFHSRLNGFYLFYISSIKILDPMIRYFI